MDQADLLKEIIRIIQIPFWQKFDFYVSFLGVILSGGAFFAANRAKNAAIKASNITKIQSVTVELSEITQYLDNLEMTIKYSTARDTLNRVHRKIVRYISPYNNNRYPILQEVITRLNISFIDAREALDSVRPVGSNIDSEFDNSVYNAIEGHFSKINGITSELLGLLENLTINEGGSND